ncbi:MAG: MaoC family dehydratase N-terminal domain-containing protein [Gammaproteobacteria bacterium]|nr:MaoC family dehydratase N-terminal domain-containing protein [Gammaproteobacteria bacterium]MDH3465919.1 MaoC family dehydratase N-terminal domain-containing protein [Gammaproteobacteria bacterium]
MTEKTLDEAILKSWIGKSQTTVDMIDARQARLLQSTLDHEPSLQDGDPLPLLWHWIYFLVPSRLSALGRDGHPRLGGFIPPVDLPRRMWAGGRFEFSAPLRLGERVTKRSSIQDVTLKQGRSGTLCFVTVNHEFTGADGIARCREEQDIVYREDPIPGSASPKSAAPPGDEEWSRSIEPSAVLLFRYSALTFNGHRIHYDRDYCRDVEGYPGLVFHGPLTATLLADLAARQIPSRAITKFSFRALAPLFDDMPFVIRGKRAPAAGDTLDLWAETPIGRLAVTASATFSL